MDEAEYCDRIAVIDHGAIVALETPHQLESAVGGDLITITTADSDVAARELLEIYGLTPIVADRTVSFHVPAGTSFEHADRLPHY